MNTASVLRDLDVGISAACAWSHQNARELHRSHETSREA
jgi:hypothetical protein